MSREPFSSEPSEKKLSALDSLDATITPKAKSNPPPAMHGAPPQPPMKLSSKTPTVIGGIGFEVDPTLAVASTEKPIATAPLAAKPVSEPVLEALTDDDLQEETRIDRTQPFDRERVVAAAAEQALDLPGLALKPTRLNSLPSVMVAEPQRSPSIPPFAVDIPPAEGTLKLPAQLMVPAFAHAASSRPTGAKNNQMTILAAAIGGGVALCAAALIALIVFATSETPASSPAATPAAPTTKMVVSTPKPREAQQSSIRSAVIETPETTPRKIESALPSRDESGTPVTSTAALPSVPSGVSASTGAASASTGRAEPKEKKSKASSAGTQPPPPPASEPVAAAPIAPPAAPVAPPTAAPVSHPTSTTGTIDIPGSLMTVMVDGEYRRVTGGKIIVSCGRHKVNAGRGTQILDVPCGGTASVQ